MRRREGVFRVAWTNSISQGRKPTQALARNFRSSHWQIGMYSQKLNTVLGGGAALWVLWAPSCYGQGFRDALADGQPCTVCPELVVVPAGQFTMGSPASEPERLGREEQVQVSIDQPLAVGRFAVTFDEWMLA
jgi:formylglycine-generating enzyme required for sulfatase activity